jgi:hypothetical protein
MFSLRPQHSLSLSQQWLGMGFECSDRGYSFEPERALCEGRPGI